MEESGRHGRQETPEERADRNWSDLLQELRVSQTGVQLLAAFLVSLPFTTRFDDLDAFQRWWYVAILALALLTVGVTLSPVALHRRTFQSNIKPQMVATAHVLTGTALALIALLLAGIAFFVVDVVLGRTAGITAGVIGLVLLGGLLVVLPRFVAARASAQRRG